ncbi:MAG: VOC family protein [Ferruginibacter sp.]
MQAIIPYLTFNGNAAEAMAFYAKALGGAVEFQQTFGESPMKVSEDTKDKIMHATFKAGELSIMCSDTNDEMGKVTPGSNISLSLNFNDEESINTTFEALAEGGKITMPLENTFWNARFGMLTDKFGFNWMLNHDLPQKEHT